MSERIPRRRGAKLEKLIQEVLPEHIQKITPVHESVEFQRYFNGDGKSRIRPGDHVAMGAFYEQLTMGLWGGHTTNRLYIHPPGTLEMFDDFEESGSLGDEQEVSLVKPDVFHMREDGNEVYWESKATRYQQTCNLIDAQISRYIGIQLTRKKSRIKFALFRHRFTEN